MSQSLLRGPKRRSMLSSAGFRLLALTVLLELPVADAHGENTLDAHSAHSHMSSNATESQYLPSYFAHSEHSAVLYSHVVLMVIAWIFILPISVVLSISRSRKSIFTQLVFVAVNAVGVVLATIYNAQTPDLYPNNAHHKLGWIVTWITASQCAVKLISTISEKMHKQSKSSQEAYSLLPSSLGVDDDHDHRGSTAFNFTPPHSSRSDEYRFSESPTGSSTSSTVHGDDDQSLPSPHKEYDGNGSDDGFKDVPMDADTKTRIFWPRKSVAIASSRIWSYIMIGNAVIDRLILQIGFIALVSGIATMGRFFEGPAIFAGLAHWIKGGVFFWLGLLTLGRWSGSFGDIGWAWNVRPTSIFDSQEKHNRWRPSAEFTESFLIFFYGSTNIFLEHLGNWGGSWSSSDFEHLAITVLFLGGGACGMIVESTTLRGLLNLEVEQVVLHHTHAAEEQGARTASPEHHKFSLNPMPALVIMLLGIMMSSHHQATMTSTMIHKQWGQLLAGAAFARGMTYFLIYLRPPTSILPSRPPTELLASFGLIAGGIIFMASASDIVDGMIHHDLDAMFMYTITMGLVGLIMAWVLIVLAIKGLATRTRGSRFLLSK